MTGTACLAGPRVILCASPLWCVAQAGPDLTVEAMPFARLPEKPWCGCLDRQRLRDAFADIRGEFIEAMRARSRSELADEISDVAFGIGRALGSMTGRRYVPVPFAGAHIAKIAGRLDAHGCVRSARHLYDGSCPSSSG